ncbi:MAG: hypothetical protein HKN44_06195 [Ilumatobacter sp.]|nr:hypothetical protein [Ilumatobacter sp.]
MIISNDNISDSGNTRLRSTVGGLLSNRNILTVSDDATSSAYESAIGAVAQGNRITNGFYAYTESRSATDATTGHAIVARKTSGARSNIYMPANGSAPTADTYRHSRGELRFDSAGTLWCCVGSGTPGSWRRLAGPATAGAVHAINPRRVYDSRFVDGALAAGAERVIAVNDGIDVESGAVNAVNVVPAGATAIYFNLAITETVGGGFLQLAPGTATVVTAATINWSGPNETISNASFSSIDTDRQVKILSGGTGSTQFIIDITGYTL